MAEQRPNGLSAYKQGLVNYSGQMDRIRALGRKATIGNRGVVPYAPKGDNEFDIRTDEFALTQLYDTGTEFAEEEDISRPPVLTTVAGIQLEVNPKDYANPQRLLSKVTFAGIAQDNIDFRPEIPGYNPGEKDLPLQIAGVFHDTAVGQDFPFGHKIRLCLPTPDDYSAFYENPNYVEDKNVGKARLIAKPEGDGRPFGQRMNEWLGANVFGIDVESPNPSDLTPTELAFKEFSDCLTDTILLCAASLTSKLAAGYGLNDRNRADVDAFTLEYGLDDRFNGREVSNAAQDKRKDAMKDCFAFMIAEYPEYQTELSLADNPNNNFNKLRMEHMLKTLAAFADAVRIDNQWVIGDVIRPAKEGRKYYGMLK